MANETGLEAYVSLGSDINKQKTNDPTRKTTQGFSSEKLPELVLDMSDEEIIIAVCGDCTQEEKWTDEECRVCRRNIKAGCQAQLASDIKAVKGKK